MDKKTALPVLEESSHFTEILADMMISLEEKSLCCGRTDCMKNRDNEKQTVDALSCSTSGQQISAHDCFLQATEITNCQSDLAQYQVKAACNVKSSHVYITKEDGQIFTPDCSSSVKPNEINSSGENNSLQMAESKKPEIDLKMGNLTSKFFASSQLCNSNNSLIQTSIESIANIPEEILQNQKVIDSTVDSQLNAQKDLSENHTHCENTFQLNMPEDLMENHKDSKETITLQLNKQKDISENHTDREDDNTFQLNMSEDLIENHKDSEGSVKSQLKKLKDLQENCIDSEGTVTSKLSTPKDLMDNHSDSEGIIISQLNAQKNLSENHTDSRGTCQLNMSQDLMQNHEDSEGTITPQLKAEKNILENGTDSRDACQLNKSEDLMQNHEDSEETITPQLKAEKNILENGTDSRDACQLNKSEDLMQNHEDSEGNVNSQLKSCTTSRSQFLSSNTNSPINVNIEGQGSNAITQNRKQQSLAKASEHQLEITSKEIDDSLFIKFLVDGLTLKIQKVIQNCTEKIVKEKIISYPSQKKVEKELKRCLRNLNLECFLKQTGQIHFISVSKTKIEVSMIGEPKTLLFSNNNNYNVIESSLDLPDLEDVEENYENESTQISSSTVRLPNCIKQEIEIADNLETSNSHSSSGRTEKVSNNLGFTDLRKFTCMICFFRFSGKLSLERHLHSHSNETMVSTMLQFMCYNIQETNYSQLQTTHENNRYVTCGVCSKTFSNNVLAYHHERSHYILFIIDPQDSKIRKIRKQLHLKHEKLKEMAKQYMTELGVSELIRFTDAHCGYSSCKICEDVLNISIPNTKENCSRKKKRLRSDESVTENVLNKQRKKEPSEDTFYCSICKGNFENVFKELHCRSHDLRIMACKVKVEGIL